jgi:Asp-tRNA(Asn)/Glu-tRNA(Gln) amidotransferase A subunit family amidase
MAQGFTTATEALEALGKRTVSAEELTAECLGRIEANNPDIRAVADVLADSALAAARDVDRRRAEGAPVGRLRGLPILVKDLIDVAGAHGRAGLDFLADYVAAEDALLVRRLREADAVILGVTETDSGAFLVRTPQTRHPHAPGRVVGGSSGGSAAAVAAGFGFCAIGTDTGGSIRIPAACCSLAGLKPTTGRVPLDGVRPLAWSLDHAGPIVVSAGDIAPFAGVLDPGFEETGGKAPARPSVGYDPDYYRDAVPEVREDFERALRLVEAAGCEVKQIELPDPDHVLSFHMINLPAEAAAYHFEVFPGRLDDYPAGVRAALKFADRTPSWRYVQAERQRHAARAVVDVALTQVDMLMAPTLPVLPPKLEDEKVATATGEVPVLLAMIRYTCLFNQSGHPVVSVPVSRGDEGIGSSVQFIGPRGLDRDVVDFACLFETACGPL